MLGDLPNSKRNKISTNTCKCLETVHKSVRINFIFLNYL